MTGLARLPVQAVLAAMMLLGLVGCQPQGEGAAQVVAPVPDLEGFSRADGPQPFNFPADFGPHPDYQTEWWYYTGNLVGEDGRRFGYQLTFFRRALEPADMRVDRPSDWAVDQIYLGHFAVTDVAGEQYSSFERYARGSAGLSGAQAEPYRVWLENWSAEEIDIDSRHLRASQDGVTLDLIVTDTKGPVLQGRQGYSQKGPDPGNASYYYSFTRLQTEGTIIIDGREYRVTGWSWMDHEYSTSALAEGQIGWDWFSIQLDNNTEIMLYYMRRDDGTIDPLSKGSFVDANGQVTLLTLEDFSIEVTDTWRSPASNAAYPAGWLITIPSQGIRLEGSPLLANQEFDASFRYWEGAIALTGSAGDEAISGFGYVEMTGYAGSLEGRF